MSKVYNCQLTHSNVTRTKVSIFKYLKPYIHHILLIHHNKQDSYSIIYHRVLIIN